MKLSPLRCVHWVAIVAVAGVVGEAEAAPIAVPTGLNAGDSYRLVFVTSGTRDQLSSDISVYDAFVTAAAESNATLLGLGTTWQAIASTAAVAAYDHIGGGFTAPVYNLNGELVATGAADLWNGSIAHAISYDETGTFRARYVWTGSNYDGQAGAAATTLGGTSPRRGSSIATNLWWMFECGGCTAATGELALYGISGILTVPEAPVPEPSSMGLVGLALAGLVWRGVRGREWRG